MRSVWIAVVLVLVIASVGLAQPSFVPHAQIGSDKLKVEVEGTTIETTFTTIGLGATVDLGNGIIASGTYALGRGGKVDSPFFPEELDTNKLTHLHFNLGYALNLGTLTLGPLVDYSSSEWTFEDGGTEGFLSANNFGYGAFASVTADRVSVTASYVHRPDATAKYKWGAMEETLDKGKATTLSIDASIPLSGSFSLVGGYEVDTWYSKDDDEIVSSGFMIGASYAF